jgi:L-ascorbate metabolism protein UlaG (beta-lactamase superfamily)
VFREPGKFSVGDVMIQGIEGRHADPYGKDFEQKNTIFVLETGGLVIAHLGDNGPLSDAAAREMGNVDVLLFPADGMDHILTTEQINANLLAEMYLMNGRKEEAAKQYRSILNNSQRTELLAKAKQFFESSLDPR